MNNKFLISMFFTSTLAYGMDFNKELLNGAAFSEFQEVVDALDNGADINATDESSGYTALHWASLMGDKDIVNILLKHGANVNAKDAKNKTPLKKAIKFKNPEVVKILLSVATIIVDKSDLEYAKKVYFDYAKKVIECENLMKKNPQWRIAKSADLKSVDNKSKIDLKRIGRMLIRHIGLYSGQSCISKQGIVGVHELPPELAHYIATFANQ